MAKIECTNDQLRLIQDALELYSRVGIMQLDHILYHPSVEQMIYNQFTPKKKLEVGDQTERGEIVEINKKSIKTKGHWGDHKERLGDDSGEWVEEIREWFDIDKIKLSCDYSKYHPHVDKIKKLLNEVKNLITGDPYIEHINASYGIGRLNEGEHNITAYDMIQAIRHEFWKVNPNRSNITVDSNVCKFGTKPLIKIELDEKL